MKKLLLSCLMCTAIVLAFKHAGFAAQPSLGIENLGHVGIGVTDLPRALRFYEGILGLTETFRLNRPDGSARLVYLHIPHSRTFVELFPAAKGEPPAHLPKVYHLGFFVKNLQATLHGLSERGYPVPADAYAKAAKSAADGTYLYFILDPDGNRIELSQINPNSFQGKVLRREP